MAQPLCESNRDAFYDGPRGKAVFSQAINRVFSLL